MIALATVQGDVIEVHKLDVFARRRVVGGIRSVVSSFSKASRRRLIVRMNKLDIRKMRTSFVTLTFAGMPTIQEARRAFKMFMQRLRRKYIRTSAVWRLEHQQRGAIHFHVLFFKLPYIDQAKLQEEWIECTREPLSIVHIRLVSNKKHMMHYVSKYVAKASPEKSSTSLDIDAYRHETGRHWGIFNEKCLPYGKIYTRWLEGKDALNYFWWTTRVFSCGKAGSQSQMTLLFADNALTLLNFLTSICDRSGKDVKNEYLRQIAFRNSMTC